MDTARNTKRTPVTKFTSKNRQQRATTQRPIAKKKAPVMKLALMLLLSGGAGCGAIYWGINYNKQVKEQRLQKEMVTQRLSELKEAEENAVTETWHKVSRVYAPALKDVSLVVDAIDRLNTFITKHPDSARSITAKNYIVKLESVKRKEANALVYKKRKRVIQAAEIVNNLIKEAQIHINSKQYLEAHNLFANYSGPLLEETKIERQKNMAQLNSLADKEREKIAVDKMAEMQQQRESIVADVVQNKSIKPLLNINEEKLQQLYPGILPILSDYKNVNKIIKNYFKLNVGKVISITQGNKVHRCKIIKTESSKMLVNMIVNGRKLSTKIKYKSLSLSDNIRAIESVNTEAAALYGALSSLRKGDKKKFKLYSANTGPLASELINNL